MPYGHAARTELGVRSSIYAETVTFSLPPKPKDS